MVMSGCADGAHNGRWVSMLRDWLRNGWLTKDPGPKLVNSIGDRCQSGMLLLSKA